MWNIRSSILRIHHCRMPGRLMLGLTCLFVLIIYVMIAEERVVVRNSNPVSYEYESTDIQFLVFNPKCRIPSLNPMDPSITKFVKKQDYVACPTGPLMSYVSRDPTNGSISIAISASIDELKNLSCCWAPIARPVPGRPPKGQWDSTIETGACAGFEKRAWMPQNVTIVMIKCHKGKKHVYENVHAFVNPMKVKSRSMKNAKEPDAASRKLSVLVIGMDSVSRLNFQRSMPKTKHYLDRTDWISLDGYNKMGENTFPNLMAILTGQNITGSYANCKPVEAFGLDQCPMIWYNFRNANYVTAYGEDVPFMGTFNFLKVGFVDPPTDYYLRPYLLAASKLVNSSRFHGIRYCEGPESSVDRIYNYAIDFARYFRKTPYFGLFWTNAATHNDVNGASSLDNRMLEIFQTMENDGILNDAMIVFLSDHGTRWGGLRDTFVGWYEERLPFIYIRLPEWFRDEEPQAYDALRSNQRRLTSPYDLYETLRDVLTRAGGKAESSSGCDTCQTLLRPVPISRGCEDAGVPLRWCTCHEPVAIDTTDKIALGGAAKFLDHVENIIKHYRDKAGKRLCLERHLTKIISVKRMSNGSHDAENLTLANYLWTIEVSPGHAKYEFTLRNRGGDDFFIDDNDVNPMTPYGEVSRCLAHGLKQYCHCKA